MFHLDDAFMKAEINLGQVFGSACHAVSWGQVPKAIIETTRVENESDETRNVCAGIAL